MNKTAIKNFAVWARRKLMEDTRLKANSLGTSGANIAEKMEHSTKEVHFFEIGMEKPLELTGTMLRQRTALAKLIEEKAKTSDLATAFEIVVEEVAYTWFNRLIALRFMEVNDYLPSGLPVLSSKTEGKSEPDLVTSPFSADFSYTSTEQTFIEELQDKGDSDGLFGFLFVKQCNTLNDILPKLFEKTADYTELLLNLSYIKEDSVVSRLVHDIPEEDFREAVEIVGWLYQYYNEERKNEVINIYKGTVKKEDVPAATQLFTTDWVVRYMVDNSLARYWLERNPSAELLEKFPYFFTDKEGNFPKVEEKITPEELTFFDPCMGSGHILVYAFDVLMEIYQSQGYSERKAAQNILLFNLFGLDIDPRAYQLAYFALMMKARSYDRRFFTRGISPMVYCPVNDVALQNFGSLYQVEEVPPEPQEEDFLPMDLLTYTLEERQQDWSFLALLMKKYSVVATNPPYLNKMNPDMKKYMNDNYKDYSADLFSIFMYRNFDFCVEGGYSAFMTPFVWMFIKTYEKLRSEILTNRSITSLIQMEYSAFEEATVPICSFVMKNGKETGKSLCIRLSDFKGGMEVQKNKVVEALSNKNCGYFYEAQQENFSKIPGSPIAYWVSERVFVLAEKEKMFEDFGTTRAGMITGNNEMFVRRWHEVSVKILGLNYKSRTEATSSKNKWFPYNKGGEFRKWYGNNEYVVNWENDGTYMRNFQDSKGKIPAHAFNLEYIFKENVTWSSLSSYKYAARYTDYGFLYDASGSFADVETENIKYTVAFLCSIVTFFFLSAMNPTLNFQKGNISTLPFILDKNQKPTIDTLVQENISLSKTDWDSFETSWDFEKHPLLQGNTIESAFSQWETDCKRRFNTLKSNEEELNRIFIEIYGLEEELTPDVEEKDVTVRLADLKRDVKSLLSYIVGSIFGRYSLDRDGLAFAGGEWDEGKYQTSTPTKENCLVICEEHFDGKDLCSQVVEFLKKAYGEDNLQENLDFIAKALGTKGDTSRDCINNYFLKEFYKDHLKTYQKRPIYWQFDSGKEGGFKALLYIHRYHQDNLGVIRTDYLHKLQSVYGEMIRSAEYDLEHGGKNLKGLEKLQRKLAESTNYEVKLAHLANRRIDLDLDDGVKVNYEKLQTGQDGKKIDVLGKI